MKLPKQCKVCKKWFYKGSGKCPDEADHGTLGVKCCHYQDTEAGPPRSSQDRKYRKKVGT